MGDIILITIDSLRRDHTSCYGYNRETTPNIDALADDSALFENAFSHAGSTRHSFPSILTSTYAPMYGGSNSIDNRLLISELLDDIGYATAGFHSNPFLNYGYSDGFDRFVDPKDNPSKFSKLRQFVQRRLSHEGVPYRAIKYVYKNVEKAVGGEVGSAYVNAEDITDIAIDWIDDTDSEDRFLWVHYMDPHHPYVPPGDFQDYFLDTRISERESLRMRKKMLDNPAEVTQNELDKLKSLYDAETRYTDHHVGRLLDHLDSDGDISLVTVTSDHGEEFREHGRFSHGTWYEECISVPLIVNRKGQSGKQRADLTGLIDLPPTIAGAAEAEIPEEYLGSDLINREAQRDYLLGGWKGNNEEIMFCRTGDTKGVVRNGERLLFDVEQGSDKQVDTEFPSEIEEGLSIFSSYMDGPVSHQDEIDDSAQNRLKNLGYLE